MTTAKPGRAGLTPKEINNLASAALPGMWSHRSGAVVVIAKSGLASFALRYTAKDTKRRRLMTLQPINSAVTAATLRSIEHDCTEYRRKIRDGIDPLEMRAATNKRAAPSSFEAMALLYVDQRKVKWKGNKSAEQWIASLQKHAFSLLGKKQPHLITTNDVLNVMQKRYGNGTFFNECNETAMRVRARIETVIALARVLAITNPTTKHLWDGHINPATWHNNLELALSHNRVRTHFKAMDFRDLPAFYSELQERKGIAVKALSLTILTAARSSEILNSERTEFDIDAATWVVPAARMKGNKEHTVPLSKAAVDVFNSLHRVKGNKYTFPGSTNAKRPLHAMAMLQQLRSMRPSQTVHGLRSSFRDWLSETTTWDHDVCEMALAHVVKSKVERAYRRGELFTKRKQLMQMWADYLTLSLGEYQTKWSRHIAS